jgi:heterodisulfide reductase subunit C
METVRRHGRIHEMAFMTRYFTAMKSPTGTVSLRTAGI